MVFFIIQDEFFKIDRGAIHCQIPISIKQSVFGGEVTVPSFHGDISLKIPKKTPNGTVLKIKGKGIRTGVNSNSFGDMYAHVFVDIPDVDDKHSDSIDETNFSYENINTYENIRKNTSEKIKKSSQS